MQVLELIFSSLWHWVGTTLILGGLASFLFRCWNRLIRHFNIKKHGWPPEHLDADGDAIENEKDLDEN